MSQRTSRLYNFVNHPIVYMIFQKLMSGTSFRKKIIKHNIKNKRARVLDIGCGPAEILNYIPKTEYYGFDIDKRSIKYAKSKFIGKNYHFFCKRFVNKDLKRIPKVDYVVLFGILHHLKDNEVRNILRLCKKIMKKNAKLITEDPILLSKQNPIAKFIITRDRGLNVRTKSQYLELVKVYFKKINSKITHQYFIPYTWFSMACRK